MSCRSRRRPTTCRAFSTTFPISTICQVDTGHGGEALLRQLLGGSRPTDYANIQDYVAKILDLHGRFLTQASVPVGRARTRAELTSKFLTPDAGDFSAASPLYTKLAAAAKAQNEAQVSALLGQLDA